jgi:hypothetical protein
MKAGKAALARGSVLLAGMFLMGLSFVCGSSAEELLKATPDQLNVGNVPEGKTVEVTSSIQNMGSTPIEITGVKTS